MGSYKSENPGAYDWRHGQERSPDPQSSILYRAAQLLRESIGLQGDCRDTYKQRVEAVLGDYQAAEGSGSMSDDVTKALAKLEEAIGDALPADHFRPHYHATADVLAAAPALLACAKALRRIQATGVHLGAIPMDDMDSALAALAAAVDGGGT